MTTVYGVTRDGRKVTASDSRVLPVVVVYDPDLTLDLPADLTAGTGANAFAHCVEGVYSLRRAPLATAAALAAVKHIDTALPRLIQDGRDRAARELMLVGAHLAGVTLAHAGMALHHAICHALGAAGVPHGVANAIVLPHVMRFNLIACIPELASAGRALQGETTQLSDIEAAEAAHTRTVRLLDGLPLPHRLRDANVSSAQLVEIAAHVLSSSATRANPRHVTDAAEIEQILYDAW
jgi:alcohol dehydrogenase class IV